MTILVELYNNDLNYNLGHHFPLKYPHVFSALRTSPGEKMVVYSGSYK